MSTPPQTAEEIAKEAARDCVYKCTSSNNQSLMENWEQSLARHRTECEAIILTAARRIAALEAARMVRDSGAVEELETAHDAAPGFVDSSATGSLRSALAKLRAITQQP